MSLRCRFMARGAPLFFGSGTTPKRNYLSFWYRFILERCGTKKWPRSKERQERGRNDPECLGKGDRTVAKEGRTIRELRSFRFSFLSFGHRSSFESRSESFRKKRKFRNDTGTRSERGGRVGKSGSVSPKEKSLAETGKIFSKIWLRGRTIINCAEGVRLALVFSFRAAP